MAGSSGAGKTEISKEYVIALNEMKEAEFEWLGNILRIDPDDLRDEFSGYIGNYNSRLFQRAVSTLVERVHDLLLKQRQLFILDGKLASLDVARRNIKQSLQKGRGVKIFYVHQHPDLAWQFICSREKVEGEKVALSSSF